MKPDWFTLDITNDLLHIVFNSIFRHFLHFLSGGLKLCMDGICIIACLIQFDKLQRPRKQEFMLRLINNKLLTTGIKNPTEELAGCFSLGKN